MALQLSYEDASGVIHSEAYIRLTCQERNVDGKWEKILVRIYTNKAARDAVPIKQVVSGGRYVLMAKDEDYDKYFSDEVMKQADNSPEANAYKFVKEEYADTFSDAIDV